MYGRKKINALQNVSLLLPVFPPCFGSTTRPLSEAQTTSFIARFGPLYNNNREKREETDPQTKVGSAPLPSAQVKK